MTGLGREQADATTAEVVITLAYAPGMTVTAEGIGTVEETARLRQPGCKTGQGDHFAWPLPPDGIAAWAAIPGGVSTQGAALLC